MVIEEEQVDDEPDVYEVVGGRSVLVEPAEVWGSRGAAVTGKVQREEVARAGKRTRGRDERSEMEKCKAMGTESIN